MGMTGYDLSQYPLEEHYKTCREYAKSMDWDGITESIRENGMVGVDISNVISLFSHLELDPEYRMFCYMTLSYHGMLGKIAAVKKGDDWLPKRDADGKFHVSIFDTPQLPECAFPPMEAIFHDGTPEGYFEAVLCELFLRAFPNVRYEHDPWRVVLNTSPEDYEEQWDSLVALADWRPRYSDGSVIALLRRFESGIGSSDGIDRIYLTEFEVHSNVNWALTLSMLRTKAPVSGNHITSSDRYSETKRCCVFSQSSVLVAKEKR